MTIARRDLLLAPALAAVTTQALAAEPTGAGKTAARPGPLCFFSKYLPKMQPGAMARAIKAHGFGGVELTVRTGGHVAPAEVTTELPRAVEAIRGEGIVVPIITTELLDARDPTAVPILSTAGKLGVPVFKPGYNRRYDFRDIERELREAAADIRGLYQIARRYQVQLGFHNHAECVGASVWDANAMLAPLDKRWAGFCFDTRHAVAEGGQSAWKASTHLVSPRLKGVSVKDFFWEKTSQGWRIQRVPLGQGMVDLKGIFTILAQHGFAGPISVHLEYDIAGGDDGILQAAARDLDFLKKTLVEVYGAA